MTTHASATAKYQTSGFGSSAVLMALHLPMGLGHTMGELRYQGRRSGRHIALPVSYVRTGDSVVVRVADAATKMWWRNFRSPHPASIRIGGQWLTGPGRVVIPGTIEHEEVEAEYRKSQPRQQVSTTDPYVVIDVRHPGPRPSLRRRWFATVALGELLGFLAPAMVGVLVADGPPVAAVVALLIAAMIEGSVLGWFQASVLRKELRGFRSRDWVVATVVGALVAWTIGLIPVLYGEQITDWPVSVQAPVIALGAVVMVFAIGITQWYVLRERTNRAALWIWANALGWIAGLGAFALVTTPLWQPGQHPALAIAIGVLGGLAMAAAMAGTTGAFLARILTPEHLVRP